MTARAPASSASLVADGSMRNVSSSQSTTTGRAPARTTAIAVATNVLAGRITSLPGPIPAARMINSRASVPFATPTQCADPLNSAKARSNAATDSPRMKSVRPAARVKASRSSLSIDACCAARSTSGIRSLTALRLLGPGLTSNAGSPGERAPPRSLRPHR